MTFGEFPPFRCRAYPLTMPKPVKTCAAAVRAEQALGDDERPWVDGDALREPVLSARDQSR